MVFKGAIFQFTYNQDVVFNHSQLVLRYDVTQQIDLESFQMVNMSACPPTIKYDKFTFNPDLPKDHYIQIRLKKVSIGQAT